MGIITGVGTLMWQGMERFHQEEVARIMGEARLRVRRHATKIKWKCINTTHRCLRLGTTSL